MYTFLPNVYLLNNGNLLLILDVLRLIFAILIFLFSLKQFFEQKAKLHATEININSYLRLIFQPQMITTLIVLILYLLSFGTKLTKLNNDVSPYFGTDPTQDYRSVLTQVNILHFNLKEFFPMVNNFRFNIITETILIFALFARLIFFVGAYKRISIFFSYVFFSIKNLLMFILILVLFFIFFTIFANNLWGPEIKEFRDFSGALASVLMMSIGHFYAGIFLTSHRLWNLLFALLFFLTIIYFILHSFVGIYLEAYRLSSLRDGYSYYERVEDEVEEKKVEENNKEEQK